MKKFCIFLMSLYCPFFHGCGESGGTDSPEGPPVITFSSDTGEYTVKFGSVVRIGAEVTGASDVLYTWTEEGRMLSTEPSFDFTGDVQGEHFVTLRVDAPGGTAHGQVKVTVAKNLAPEIILDQAAIMFSGREYEITPELSFEDPTVTYEWILDGTTVGTSKTYTFRPEAVGNYSLLLKVMNEDGRNNHVITITVMPPPEPELWFDDGRYRTRTGGTPIQSVCLGRSLVLAPVRVMIDDGATFRWTVDGTVQSEMSEFFTFTPAEKGRYVITASATQDGKTTAAEVYVDCVDEEGTYFRPFVAGTDEARATRVFEFSPAPGQFVNVPAGATAETMRATAQAALEQAGDSYFVSLGAFGGYVVVGFDHSVVNVDGLPDLIINGNAFVGSNEPGIVYVMQDENGDGLPNDTWYELRGSETGRETASQRSAVTYFRPGNRILYMDSRGETGSLPGTITRYLSYTDGDRITFTGTHLAPRFGIVNGNHHHGPYDWGYVDNLNSRDGFYIDDAMQADGTPADLQYIDFVKVQTGQLVYSDLLGEVSTETCVPIDFHNR